jgi:hypothetical protein
MDLFCIRCSDGTHRECPVVKAIIYILVVAVAILFTLNLVIP